jgi:hypothetical protein
MKWSISVIVLGHHNVPVHKLGCGNNSAPKVTTNLSVRRGKRFELMQARQA